MIRPLLICTVLFAATPALAQSPLKPVLAKLGQGELTPSDGPSYRAIVGGAEILRLQVAGDGRATLIAEKGGKSENRFISNRQLDALDAALADAPLSETAAIPASCAPEAGVIFETLIDGRYKYAVECGAGPLTKAVQILRGG